MSVYQRSLFIFRRDLRLVDNTALNAALDRSAEVLTAFFLDPRQQQPHPYRSEPGLAFLNGALRELGHELQEQGGRLHVYQGEPQALLPSLLQRCGIEAVFVNRDYTPFSRERDRAMARCCAGAGVAFHSYADALLTEPEQVAKGEGGAYRVFTPFYRNARQQEVPRPQAQVSGRWLLDANSGPLPWNAELAARWSAGTGRTEALARLEALTDLGRYEEERDLPALAGTSGLSAALKFGTCSVREAYHRTRDALGVGHPLIRQLYWRDFLTHVAWHWPRVFQGAFDPRFDALPWNDDRAAFERWREGRTGFPLVDAGMRQLNDTGEMHNRVRMVTAAFLVKDLHLDWRWGERYFARHLRDYDPCLNNGNWQWAASTGCDAQPWFRIFNPWRQQRRFDPEAIYIKRWVPELRELDAAAIHRLESSAPPPGYPAPMVDHREAAEETKRRYRAVAQARAD